MSQNFSSVCRSSVPGEEISSFSPSKASSPCVPLHGREDRIRFPPPGLLLCSLLGRVLPAALRPAGLGANRVAALSGPRAAASGPREAEARPAEEGEGARRAPCSRVLSHRSRDRPVCARGAGCREYGRQGARRCEGRPGRVGGPGRREERRRPRGVPGGHTALAPEEPSLRLLFLGQTRAAVSPAPAHTRPASPPAATAPPRHRQPQRRSGAGGGGGTRGALCVQPEEGRRRNHLTEAQRLDAPSARMRRRGR
nr:collagen alpha-1(I) chain-like [Camelus dromedarius]